MNAAIKEQPAGHSLAPWHMIAVGLLGMVWGVICLAQFGATGTTAPGGSGWTAAFFGASIWGSLGGSVLLLARSRWAVQAFTTALVGLMATSASLFIVPAVPANLYAMPMMVGLWVITLAIVFYASRVHQRGLLR